MCLFIRLRIDISQKLCEALFNQGLHVITSIRKPVKNPIVPRVEKLLLRKRAIIKTLFDPLKTISPIEPTRHRSVATFRVNGVVGLIAYTHQPTKPSLTLSANPLKLLTHPA